MASNTMIYMNKMRNTLPLILEHLEFEVFQELSIGTELGPQIGTQKGPSCEVC